jgi:hypothetical protein
LGLFIVPLIIWLKTLRRRTIRKRTLTSDSKLEKETVEYNNNNEY